MSKNGKQFSLCMLACSVSLSFLKVFSLKKFDIFVARKFSNHLM